MTAPKSLKVVAKRASKTKMKAVVTPIITVKPKATKPTKTAPQMIEVLVSFDTTGSMAPAIRQVRSNVRALLREMFADVPNLRMGIIAHGDYCDAGTTYVTREHRLTDDEDSLISFLDTCGDTGGGDAPECYELVLHKATKYKWTPGSKRVLVLVGDDIPHGSGHAENTLHLDWKEEARTLASLGVQICAVQALARRHATSFYSQLASISGGFHLELDDFSDMSNLIQAVARQQHGGVEALTAYQTVVSSRGEMTRGMSKIFGVLSGKKSIEIVSGSGSKVASDKYKILDVLTNSRIDDFVTANGLTFRKGRGFYQFTKSVLVQGHKEIILVNKETGEVFTNLQARKIMGLPVGVNATCRPDKDTRYLAFIQSTSNNRTLLAGTKFLYEVSK